MGNTLEEIAVELEQKVAELEAGLPVQEDILELNKKLDHVLLVLMQGA